MSQTSYIVIEYQQLKSDKIQFLQKLGVLLNVVNLHPVIKLKIEQLYT